MKKPELKATRRNVYWCGSQDTTTVQDLIDACETARLDQDCVTVEWYEAKCSAMTVTDADRAAYSAAREKYDKWAQSDKGRAALARAEAEAAERKAARENQKRRDELVARLKVVALTSMPASALDAIEKALDEAREVAP